MLLQEVLAWLNPPESVPLALIVLPILALLIGVRYLIFAGGALALLLAFKRSLRRFRIQPQEFSAAQLRREAAASALSILIFAAIGLCAVAAHQNLQIFAIYREFDAYGPVWFALSIPIAILVHDFYFYWTHRFMHLDRVYPLVHSVHHRSTNPSPLAAFAFHPLEAMIEAGGFLVVALLVPLHPIAFATVATVMILTNVIGHSAHELFPASWRDRSGLRWLNTATSHNQHHRTYRYNYGLYTLIWDRLFGTLHPGYGALYQRAASGQGPAAGQRAEDYSDATSAARSKS